MGFGHHPFEGDDRVPGPALPPAEWNMGKRPRPRGRVRGVALGLPASGPASVAQVRTRFAGLLIDALIVLVWEAITVVAFKHPHLVTSTRANGTTFRHLAIDRPPAAVALLLLIPTALYVIGFIAVRGRTIGQQVMGLRVVRWDDVPLLVPTEGRVAVEMGDAPTPGWRPAFVRWIVIGWLGIVAAFHRLPTGLATAVELVVYLWAYWDANGQGLHDKAARVVVLRSR